MENKKIELERLLIENGWVSELKLSLIRPSYFNGEDFVDTYFVKVNSEMIIIYGKSSVNPGGEYNKKSSEITWYLRHCCGASGYNPMLGDNCTACENDGKTKDKSLGEAFHGNKYLEDIIKYVKSLDDKIALQKIQDNYFN